MKNIFISVIVKYKNFCMFFKDSVKKTPKYQLHYRIKVQYDVISTRLDLELDSTTSIKLPVRDISRFHHDNDDDAPTSFLRAFS